MKLDKFRKNDVGGYFSKCVTFIFNYIFFLYGSLEDSVVNLE